MENMKEMKKVRKQENENNTGLIKHKYWKQLMNGNKAVDTGTILRPSKLLMAAETALPPLLKEGVCKPFNVSVTTQSPKQSLRVLLTEPYAVPLHKGSLGY